MKQEAMNLKEQGGLIVRVWGGGEGANGVITLYSQK